MANTWFERAVLVSLLILLLTFITIRYMIGEEQKKQAERLAAH